MRPFALCLAGLAARALASGASITAALAAVQADTTALGTAMANWNGSPFGVLPTISKAAMLYVDMRKGSHTAAASAPLSDDESFAVAQATGVLAAEVNKTLEAVIAAKPKFDRFHVTPIMYMALEVKKHAADEMSANIVAKVPENLRGIAQQLAGGIADCFVKAIEAYSFRL